MFKFRVTVAARGCFKEMDSGKYLYRPTIDTTARDEKEALELALQVMADSVWDDDEDIDRTLGSIIGFDNFARKEILVSRIIRPVNRRSREREVIGWVFEVPDKSLGAWKEYVAYVGKKLLSTIPLRIEEDSYLE